MGTPEFAATVLTGLIESNDYEILAVVTQPDRAVGRKHEIKMTPVKEVALAHHLPVYQPEKLSGSEEMTELMRLGADGIVTAAFGQFLPTKLLDSVSFAVNTHGSLLPKYRGGAPIQYAIMNGEKEAGITIMEMVKKMDAGDMIAQRAIPILEEDNLGTMFEKLAIVGRDLLLETLPQYLSGQLKPVAQNEEEVTFSPNIAPAEERIDWNKSARTIFNQVRAMNPFPIAHTFLKGERFKIYDTAVVENLSDVAFSTDKTYQPGQIVDKNKKSMLVATGDGILMLKVVQPAGKPKMDITSFINGLGQKVQIGEILS